MIDTVQGFDWGDKPKIMSNRPKYKYLDYNEKDQFFDIITVYTYSW